MNPPRATSWWILALGKSMQSGVEQWHVYLAHAARSATNLATTPIGELLQLHSYENTFMAAIVWHYPRRIWLQAQAAGARGPRRARARLSASMRSTRLRDPS
jgi:hypothetical protein